jgi:hypothetical protein
MLFYDRVLRLDKDRNLWKGCGQLWKSLGTVISCDKNSIDVTMLGDKLKAANLDSFVLFCSGQQLVIQCSAA